MLWLATQAGRGLGDSSVPRGVHRDHSVVSQLADRLAQRVQDGFAHMSSTLEGWVQRGCQWEDHLRPPQHGRFGITTFLSRWLQSPGMSVQ